MNIGTITPTATGELLGHMAIMSFDARIGFKPVASPSERAPSSALTSGRGRKTSATRPSSVPAARSTPTR